MEKELKILTATVTIQLVTVDGKRMTKAVFNQIEYGIAFDSEFKFIAQSILGYVKDSGDKYLLFTENGKLRKQKINFLFNFSFNNREHVNWATFYTKSTSGIDWKDYRDLKAAYRQWETGQSKNTIIKWGQWSESTIKWRQEKVQKLLEFRNEMNCIRFNNPLAIESKKRTLVNVKKMADFLIEQQLFIAI